MVRLNVALGAASQRYAQGLLDAFRFLMTRTRRDAGCLECSVWLDAQSTVRYTEVWSTEADMRRRVRSEPFTSLLSVVESATEATVQFDFVAETRGLDYIAEVRKADSAGDDEDG
jgi:quinol monooxygenase YgiN